MILRPANAKELFNLRHAQARNVIERIFGVIKRRFRILLYAPEYSPDIQAQIPAALCCLHNFIRIHDTEEGALPTSFNTFGGYAGNDNYAQFMHVDEMGLDDGDDDEPEATQRRDAIANEMWKDYQQELVARGLNDVQIEESDDGEGYMEGEENEDFDDDDNHDVV